MEKLVFTILLSFLGAACMEPAQESSSQSGTNKTDAEVVQQAKIGRRNFAVTWQWTTDNVQFVVDNSAKISAELSELWNQDIVENAYFDTDSPIDKLGNLPNVTFFLKAKTVEEAETILNDLTIVQKGIAAYELHPVGILWLDRSTSVINQKGITGSFVAIWETKRSVKPSDPLLKAQNAKVLELWNAGTVENVYFDNTGTQGENDITDFVFFVNANTREEAAVICESLPFFEEEIATYKMYQVGTFWMGRSKDQQ